MSKQTHISKDIALKPIAPNQLITSQKHYPSLREQISPGPGFREFAKSEIEQSIPERFSQQVRQYPQNLAIKTKNYQWTYTELEQTANKIAGLILDKCGGGQQRIALLLEHDAPAIAAILGVLKAGKTYVFLDPSYPKERLAYILSDSQTTAVATNNRNWELAVELLREEITLINIDRVDVGGDWSYSQPEITPDQLAYILYTSGSTGRPKGVMQNHRNVLHFIRNYTNNLKITSDDKLTLLSSMCFDGAIVDIFAALLNGATLYPFDLKSEGLAPVPTYLQQSEITIYHSIPTVYRHWTPNLSAGNYLPQMRSIVLGGEEVKPQDVDIYQQHFSQNCILVNLMGSTESTISLQYFIHPQTEVDHRVPVGYPLEETEIILLDDNAEVTDFYGEIGIRSPYIALGYWQQPQRTDKVFLADPEGGNKRVYRTGDLGRRRPDGTLEFMGRKDFQVKLRGYRIELPEIEAVLLQHAQVKEAVTIAREDIPGDKRLVTYVVANRSQPVISELRSFAKSKLPDYMIPATFVLLESLPLTPNGKVNRRALPAPELDTRLEASFVPPQTPTQELLADIYASVLGIESCGIHDNFFELGGHSLLGMQVISRLRETFKIEMPLRSIFEASTVAQLEAQLNRRSQNNEQLPIAPAIERVSREQDLPLSFAQERLWFLHQLEEGDTSAYNMPSVWQLTGELNIDALEKALTEIIRRHEVLRTSFQSVSGVARMALAPECQLTLAVIDLRELSEPDQSLQVQKLTEAEQNQPFDLEQAPLLRAKILQLEEQKQILLLNVHHIAFDGWSRGILRQELSAIYQAFSSGKPSPLAELPIQYADYAAWQRQWLQGEVLETQLNYWKQQLSGELPVLELPLDYPRPRVQTFTGGKKSCQLSQELTSSLKELSRQESVTLYMTLLAAFKVLLSRYSGQSDIIVGTPIANRDRTELEGLLGFFVNTLVLRTDLGGNPSFGELLGRVREVTLGAYAHKDLPFEKLVEQLQPERDLSRNPLFQVWFDMVNVPRRPLSLPGMTVENLSLGVAQSKFDLTLYVLQTRESIQLTLAYNAELFSSLRMSQLLEHYQYLLEQIVTSPEKRLSGLALLRNKQKHYPDLREQISASLGFREFARGEIEQSIPQRFSQQVRQYPQNLAIKTKNYQWTYTQLEQTANEIAWLILDKCGDAQQRIALLLEHDAPAIAAILGVLKAGKTYIFLDHSYPRERLAYILEDSQATAIATNNANRELAVELCPVAITLINIDTEDVTDHGSVMKPEITPDQLAYILYTSGSTGRPKGVMQNHRNVLHFIRNYTNNLKITADDKLTLLSSISFDAAIMDIFAALLNGATLYPFDLKSEGLAAVPEYLQQSGITIYHSTPTVFRYLESHLTAADYLPQMRLIVLGGEEVKHQDVQIYQQHFSADCILVNGLGPTESTVTLQYFIDRQTEVGNKVPVGYPVEETEIILLDDNGEVTDFYGEIGIRSSYIALGYWQQQKLTDKVFLADPDGGNKHIYRTGDLGRLRPDGSLEFLGRKDFQVKLRGYRIELPEIEAVLLQHAQVKEAVVIAREDIPGNKRLVAYVVANGSQPVISELRSFLKRKLPDYMIPAVFVILESLPLTPNGKVNRRALPAPDVSTQEVGEIPPRTTTELQLAQIWSRLLNIPVVGVRNNFFDLGGHSLLGLRLMGSIEQQFGMRLPLTTLFTEPTIESQGRLLSANPKTQSCSPLVPIRQTGSKPPFFCVHPRGGIVLCLAPLARQLDVEQPFYGLQSIGLNGEEKPLTRFENMATSFIEAIQTVQPEGPYKLGGYCLGAKIAFEMAQQLSSLGHEISLLALIDPFSPFLFKKPQPDEAKMVTSFAGHLSRLFHKELPVSANELEQLGLDEKLNYIFKEGTRLQLLPPEIGLEQMQQLFAVYQANSLASYCYVPQPFSGRITIFCAEEQLEQLAEEQIQGWSSLAASGINIHKIPGDHFSMIASEALAKELSPYLGC
ncbi:amino acid adenylation domain-containing protein [Dapis sp. BLCC M229]|uniref:amino acid adenylation domain-containing protein n=1 Tax=Dapis sp. BLCC M229 TaxID=3400188 RepID=UPI003CF15D26